MDVRFCMWNVKSLYGVVSLMIVTKVISKYKLDLMGVQEDRWGRWHQASRQIYSFLWKGE
jgi:hypothetical protein